MCSISRSSVFGALRGEVGDLRLEGADQVLRGVDDGCAEIEDARGVAAPVGGELRRLRVQPDAQHRVVGGLGRAQHVAEFHTRRASLAASPV
jgi:hypothetical protein